MFFSRYILAVRYSIILKLVLQLSIWSRQVLLYYADTQPLINQPIGAKKNRKLKSIFFLTGLNQYTILANQ